ncbi:MAG TPA: DUF1361 domain-containing protein [Methylomirabilota bacterium]|nr:DUF1361 domain-containing protein [Methylomirabilota bacterium]
MIRYFVTHELRKPLLTLVSASILATALLAARIVLTQHAAQLYLVWNVFLAWVPVMLALRIDEMEKQGRAGRWRFWTAGGAWLFFFPNAPYILTDLNHLKPIINSRWWSDLILILLFAFIGLVLAFISLHRMQGVVARRRGWAAGWLFVFAMAFLSGFGVYLGRFERWNSWDVVINPISLLGDSVNWLHRHSLKFTLLFGFFLLTAYALLNSLTSLAPAGRATRHSKGPE